MKTTGSHIIIVYPYEIKSVSFQPVYDIFLMEIMLAKILVLPSETTSADIYVQLAKLLKNILYIQYYMYNCTCLLLASVDR